MPEAQDQSATETTRARRNDGPQSDKTPITEEARSFSQQAAHGAAQAGETARAMAEAAQPLVDQGRELAEHGRRASWQMADMWRQAASPLLAMQSDFGQLFDDMFRHTFGFRGMPMPTSLRPLGQLTASGLFGLPPAELKQTAKAHVLAIELPGLARQDVDISLDDDMLVVCGRKTEESADASATYRVSERRYGRFERAFPIPPDVIRGEIRADFKDGLLKITLPRNPEALPQRKRIEIRD